MITSLIVSYEVSFSFAILNLVACAVFVIIRIYHQKKEETEVSKVSAVGFSCIFLAFLCCLAMVNVESEWYLSDLKYCKLSLQLNSVTYSLHRFLLYVFIILRVEVVNHYNFISLRIINMGKAVIGIFGISTLVCSILFTNGVAEQTSCDFDMDIRILLIFFVIDILICVGGTWMFISPLRFTLRKIERYSLRQILKRTAIWSIVSLIATLIAMITLAVIYGSGGVVGFDCSITSFSLVMMMAPVRNRVRSINHSNSNQKASVEVREITSVSLQKSSSGHE